MKVFRYCFLLLLLLPLFGAPRAIAQPTTAAPVVILPADGTRSNNRYTTVSGTAPANSDVTIFPGGFRTTATASGTFSFRIPVAADDGTYAMSAKAQSNGARQSGSSNVNSITIDATPPTPNIYSTAVPYGATTNLLLIPFTVVFNELDYNVPRNTEPVTGFYWGNVVVTGGVPLNFNGSGSTYTFDVLPNGNGPITVDVPANVAQDAFGNNSLAATRPYLVNYTAVMVVLGWNGSVSTDWFDPANWTPSGVPTDADDATILNTAPRMPVIASGNAVARNVAIGNGATLTMSGGTLDVRRDWSNFGTFAATGGTVVLGSTPQASGPTISGPSRTRFWNLTVQPNGVLLATTAGATAQRLVTLNGTLATQGNPFTLESNATGTALVVNNAGGAFAGNVTAQRYIAPDLFAPAAYRHLSAPVSLSPVSALATAGFTPVVNNAYNTSPDPSNIQPYPTVFGYDQSRLTLANNLGGFYKGFLSPASLSTPLAAGQGYDVFVAAGRAVNFVGPQNNGTLTVPLARNAGTTAADAGWALLGNPYPAPLDYSRVAAADRPNLDGAIYVYGSTSAYAGMYRSYLPGTGGNAGIGDPILPMGQGFFARVSQGQTAGSLTFRNSQRATAYQNPAYHRAAPETRPLLELTVRGATGPADALTVYFTSAATAGFDTEYDAAKLPNTNGLNLAAMANGQPVAIDGLPALGTAPVTVPLTVQVPTTGTYTLNAAQLLNLGTTRAYLRDRQTGALVDLSQQPSYPFTLNAAYTGVRFELVFGPQSALATAAASLSAQVAVFPNPASRTAFVELPTGLSRTAATAALVDALGRTLRTYALPAGQPMHTLPLTEVVPGVYSLRVATAQGTVTKKLVVE